MNFFRKLFNTEKAKVEYVESQPSSVQVDIQDLKKSEIKPYLDENLSASYWTEDSSIQTSEILQISSLEEALSRISVLEKCLNVTNQGLFLEVMDHYDMFLTGLDNIQNINKLLEHSQTLASDNRLEVMSMQNELKKRYLRIIYLQKRLTRLTGLIAELTNFKEICYAVSLSIKEAARTGDLYKALELCNDATEYIKNLEVAKYSALVGVLEKAEKRKGKIYVRMKASLRELCHEFDSHLYENVLLSYMTIASFEDINKAIQAEFMNSISRLIKEAIETCTPHLPSSSIDQMIKIIPSSHYIPTIRLIYKNLTTLMYSHHLLSRWHEENDVSETKFYPITQQFIKNHEKLQEIRGFYVEIKMSLLKNRKFIWEKIQQVLSRIIKESDHINNLTQGEIRKFLSWTNTFIEIGEDFSGLNCNELRNEVAVKCKDFFEKYHSMNLNRFLSVLEVEQWTRLPIPKDFDLECELSKNVSKMQPLAALIESFSEYAFSFSKLVQGNPFEADVEGGEEDGIRLSFSGIQQMDNSPVLCTTGMNLLKALASYIELSFILTPVSNMIFVCLSQLVELFIYECFRIFAQDSSKYQLLIELTDKEASGDQLDSYFETFLLQSRYSSIKSHIPRIKESIDSLFPEISTLFQQLHKQVITQISLAKSVIAVQTCKNLLSALTTAKSHIKKCINYSDHDLVDTFLTQSSQIVSELEDFIIFPILSKSLSLEWLVSSITSSKWEELKSDNSPFIPRIFHIFEDFQQKLCSLGGGSIPDSIQKNILKKVAVIVCESMIEGFSKVKRCNQQGKEQMKKDLKTFIAFSELDENNNRKLWEEFLEIWSSPADVIVDWVLNHCELTLRLHRSLLNTGLHMTSLNKSARNGHISAVENLYRKLIFRI